MTRWLVLPLGFFLVALAGYALLSSRPEPRRTAPAAATRAPASDAHGEIDDASRAQLRALLREADRQDAARRSGDAR